MITFGTGWETNDTDKKNLEYETEHEFQRAVYTDRMRLFKLWLQRLLNAIDNEMMNHRVLASMNNRCITQVEVFGCHICC